MPWVQLSFRCEAARADEVAERMETLGAAAVSFVNAHDVPVLEPPVGKAVLWGQTCVQGLFDAAPNQVHDLSERMGALGPGEEIAVSIIDNRDWVAETQALSTPLRFGKGLWVIPSGLSAPDDARAVVTLDAGVAFGTGSHPTTRLCLEWLSAQALEGKHVLDFGCGSGVLAIAALKLGAQRASIIDIDPQALDAACANAERNGVSTRVHPGDPSELDRLLARSGKADVLVANILLEPLLALAETLLGALSPNGSICLSGILDSQAKCLRKTYEPPLSKPSVSVLDGWARLSGKR